MSPLERHNPKLRDLEVDQAGAPPPDDTESEVDVDDEVDEAELEAALEEEEVEEFEEMEERASRLRTRRQRGEHQPGVISRLYRGQTSFDFVGRRRWWFTISALIIVAGLAALVIRGPSSLLGIDFKGGTSWTVLAPGVTQSQAISAVQSDGVAQPQVTLLGRGSRQQVQVQADLNHLPADQQTVIKAKVGETLARLAHTTPSSVSQSDVGPTWGSQVTQHAITALIVFFIVVAIYISIRFEAKMALAAFIAMVHDLLVTLGVYAIFGFQITPDTVIAILTILGYSLYDTVVVFDRVRENTKGFGTSGRMTYSEMINLSMNQTLARSINTSLVAILPVLAVLLVGAQLLGATTLQYYGLALFVGLLSGAYSSIFIAAPVLAMLKEREPRYATIRHRLESRGERVGMLTPSAAALLMGATAGGGSARVSASGRGGTIRPGAAKSARKAASSSRPAGGATKAPARAGGGGGSRPSKSSGARRPPPRPRKKKRR